MSNIPRDVLINKIEDTYKVYDQLSSTGILPYLSCLMIDARPEPKQFKELADPWQWTLVNKMIPAVEMIAKINPNKKYNGPRSFWLTLPKGHDKTTLIGRLCNWLLAYSKLPLNGISASGDQEQAQLILEAMQREATLNPWLGKRLNFQKKEVMGANGSKFKAMAADAKTSHGIRPDFIIIDEVTWWQKRDLYDSLSGSKGKKFEHCIFIVITNAGIQYDWQWEEKEKAKQSSNWFVYEAPGPIASWIKESDMEEVKKSIPFQLYQRMYLNQWLDPSESCGFLTRSEVMECSKLGVDLKLNQNFFGDQSKLYLASIDYGPVKDRTVMSVMHQELNGMIVIDHMAILEGKNYPGKRVPVLEVENWLDSVRKKFNLAITIVDPYQMEGTIQKFTPVTPIKPFDSRGGKGNYEIFQALRSCIINKGVAWYPGCGDVLLSSGRTHTIEDEISELITKKMGYGYRIDTLPGKHDDRAVSLAQGLVHILQNPLKKDLYISDYFF